MGWEITTTSHFCISAIFKWHNRQITLLLIVSDLLDSLAAVVGWRGTWEWFKCAIIARLKAERLGFNIRGVILLDFSSSGVMNLKAEQHYHTRQSGSAPWLCLLLIHPVWTRGETVEQWPVRGECFLTKNEGGIGLNLLVDWIWIHRS